MAGLAGERLRRLAGNGCDPVSSVSRPELPPDPLAVTVPSAYGYVLVPGRIAARPA
jgi:hypothetical protein